MKKMFKYAKGHKRLVVLTVGFVLSSSFWASAVYSVGFDSGFMEGYNLGFYPGD